MRDHMVKVMLSEDEDARLRRLARERETTVSEVLRQLIREAAQGLAKVAG